MGNCILLAYTGRVQELDGGGRGGLNLGGGLGLSRSIEWNVDQCTREWRCVILHPTSHRVRQAELNRARDEFTPSPIPVTQEAGGRNVVEDKRGGTFLRTAPT